MIHKYNSELYSSRQRIARAEPYGATSPDGEDPFTPINQASNDEEAAGKPPDEDEGAIVKGKGRFLPVPTTTVHVVAAAAVTELLKPTNGGLAKRIRQRHKLLDVPSDQGS